MSINIFFDIDGDWKAVSVRLTQEDVMFTSGFHFCNRLAELFSQVAQSNPQHTLVLVASRQVSPVESGGSVICELRCYWLNLQTAKPAYSDKESVEVLLNSARMMEKQRREALGNKLKPPTEAERLVAESIAQKR